MRERRGAKIGGNDMLIAAHALELSCVVVTRNVRELARVAGLRAEVEDSLGWWTAEWQLPADSADSCGSDLVRYRRYERP